MAHVDIGEKFIGNLEKLKSERGNRDSVYQDITDYVLPNRGDFTRESVSGERKDRIIYDFTATIATEQLASILHSGLTDPSTRWFNLRPNSTEQQDDEEVKRWIEEVHRILFNVFTSSESGFNQQNHEYFLDLVGYGTSIMWVSEEDGKVVFQARHLSEIYMEENVSGIIDTVYRQFKMTARQAAQMWGEDNLGREIVESLGSEPHKKYNFVHAVIPKKDYERSIGKPVGPSLDRFNFISLHISEIDKKVISTKGFHEMPYIVARWTKRIGEVEGISPNWNVLSGIKMVNSMQEVILKSAQKEVDPPLIMSDDGVVMPLQTFPGGVNIGGINDEGKELIRTLQTGANHQISLEMLDRQRQDIRSAFFVDQFNEREGVQPLTATESIHRQEDKLRLIGPMITRIEDEYLKPLVTRLLSMLDRKGMIPPPPAGLIDGDLDLEYVSPLAFTQKANQLLAYNRFFANAGTFIELKPDVMDNIEMDTSVRSIAEKSGVPLTEIKPQVEVEQIREIRAEQVQEEQLKANIQVGAETAATLQKSGIPVVPEE